MNRAKCVIPPDYDDRKKERPFVWVRDMRKNERAVTMTLHGRARMDPLTRNQLIGGICAAAVVAMALIRIFVLHAATDGILMNLMSVANAVLSLVVLMSAVLIILKAKNIRSFDSVLQSELNAIDDRYGALIVRSAGWNNEERIVFSIATNTDAIFITDKNDMKDLKYVEKFSFSSSFKETKHIFFYLNYVNLEKRAAYHGETPKIVGRLLARDIAVAIQRAFSDILAAHAIEVGDETDRSVVTIHVKHAESPEDARRIAAVIDYMLFLHFVAV